MNKPNTKAKSRKSFKQGKTSSKPNDNAGKSAKKSFKKFKKSDSNKKWKSSGSSFNRFKKEDNTSSDRKFNDNNGRNKKRRNYRNNDSDNQNAGEYRKSRPSGNFNKRKFNEGSGEKRKKRSFRDNNSEGNNYSDNQRNKPSGNFNKRKFSDNNGEKRERRNFKNNDSENFRDGEGKQKRKRFNKFGNDNRGRRNGGGGKGRSGNGGRGRGGQRGGGFKGQKIAISAFINKPSSDIATVEEFKPKHKFSDFNIDGKISINLKNRGYENPTPIQDQAIPNILAGKDIVGLANTGTGKTAAFLIPLIDKILKNKNNQVLVLAPTRELALQIEKEFQIITNKMNLFSVVCVGGANIRPQLQKLRRHQHLIIGTPGRTIDLIKRNALKLTQVKTIVIDEADQMLDMGFLNDVRFIMEKVSKERHTLCFSATMPPAIEALIKDFLNDPIKISVKTRDTSENVHQDIVKIKGRDKKEVLYDMITEDEFKKVLVFGRTKHGVEKLSKSLNKSGIKAESIHGNKSHTQRQIALKKFTNDQANVLVATDVAARGLDIKNVTHVINYDIPATYDDYVHRIGRTGRANNQGKALTFVD